MLWQEVACGDRCHQQRKIPTPKLVLRISLRPCSAQMDFTGSVPDKDDKRQKSDERKDMANVIHYGTLLRHHLCQEISTDAWDCPVSSNMLEIVRVLWTFCSWIFWRHLDLAHVISSAWDLCPSFEHVPAMTDAFEVLKGDAIGII